MIFQTQTRATERACEVTKVSGARVATLPLSDHTVEPVERFQNEMLNSFMQIIFILINVHNQLSLVLAHL